VGWHPEKGKLDKHGQVIEHRITTPRISTATWCWKSAPGLSRQVREYLKATDRMAKTIVFCDDIDHAERMRQALVKLIPAAPATAAT
jgi:type I restriction enzyme R subunit